MDFDLAAEIDHEAGLLAVAAHAHVVRHRIVARTGRRRRLGARPQGSGAHEAEHTQRDAGRAQSQQISGPLAHARPSRFRFADADTRKTPLGSSYSNRPLWLTES